MPDIDTAVGREVLQEQFRTLTKQVPIMYGSLLINSCFLGFATFSTAPLWLSVGVPALLGIAVIGRILIWLRRRNVVPDADQIARSLRTTLVAGSVLALFFGSWGQLLFTDASLVQRSCIGLFIFINCISVCYCLQALPGAGQLVLLLGGLPMAFRLLITGDWLLVGLGINIIFISFVVLKVMRTNYEAFTGALFSRSQVIAERERALDAEGRAHALAYRDALTGLPNRNALRERLDNLGGLTGAGEIALLIVDLDRFKPVNDVHGHLAGDELLREVGDRLSALAPGGTAYRLGGDEFALLIEVCAGQWQEPGQLARRLVQGLAEPFCIGDLVHHIGASIGISIYPSDASDRDGLMRRADIALYEAKEGGRNQYRAFAPAMEAEITRRSAIERELRDAIAADALRPYYQPLVDLSTGRAVGFEMLARWPRLGSAEIGPDQFIPVAEESGLINELMLQLLERACRDVRTWDPHLTLAINVSPVQLRDPWLSEKVLATLTRTGLPPRRLAIEITENALIDDSDNTRRTIESFKNQGMRIELDDFGTGYSSLRHLRMLPFDKIKIDRSFVQAIGNDPEALNIIRAITSLGASMDLPVIAEGVENAFVAAQLRDLGCAEGQGYHFGEAVPAHQVGALLGSLPREIWSGKSAA